MMPVDPLMDVLFDPSSHWPSRIEVRWIDDWSELGQRLAPPHQEHQVRLRGRLWALLPPQVQNTIAAGAEGRELDEETRQRIVDAFNALLARPDLYTTEDFADRELPESVEEILQQDLAGLEEKALRQHNLVLALWAMYPDWSFWDRFGWSQWLEKGWRTLRGYPEFNWMMWFLICLFTVEFYHFVAVRFLTSAARVALAIPFFYVAGWFATVDMERFGDLWFFREGVLLYSFYLLGFLLRRTEAVERLGRWWSRLALFAASGAVLLLTFDLNPGSKIIKPVVLVNLSQHGHPLYFAITAVAGCLAVVALACLTPRSRVLSFTGRHTLILMGLNEFFFRFGNFAIADVLDIPPSQAPILFWCTIVTLAFLAMCVPLVWLLDRYVPQLVGKPRMQGPLLPSLV